MRSFEDVHLVYRAIYLHRYDKIGVTYGLKRMKFLLYNKKM